MAEKTKRKRTYLSLRNVEKRGRGPYPISRTSEKAAY